MPTTPNITTILEKFLTEADRQNAGALNQLGGAYKQLYKRLSEKIELEARRIFENGGENVTRVWLQKRLADLHDQIAEEVKKYSVLTESVIDVSAADALTLGSKHAVELMKLATLGQKTLVGVDFNKLNTAQINTIIGFLSQGSPLRARIEQMSGYFADKVTNELIEAIALGYNPYKTAKNITPFLSKVMETATNGMASVFATALRMTRTAQIWTYREAARANYQQNADVVTGWQWVSSKDDLTCPACLSMDGTIHNNEEPLDGHPNCRCFPIPVVLDTPLNSPTSGQDYFESLSEAQQRDILGDKAYEALQAGQISFSDLNKQVDDEVYGSFRVVPSLKDLIGE